MSHKNPVRTVGTARHLVLRGHDGLPCFIADEDYLVFLDCLKEEAQRHQCSIHAYALLADQVHVLASADAGDRLALMMRGVSGRYVDYVNYIYQRNGAFWEGRRESTAIDSERCLLDCHRDIEWHPVRARVAASPAEYRWSSYEHHAHGREDGVIRDHPAYLGLGTTQDERQLTYRELFHPPLPERAPAEFRAAGHRVHEPAETWSRDRFERQARRARPRRNAKPWLAVHAAAAA